MNAVTPCARPIDVVIDAYRAAEAIAREFDESIFTPKHDAWEAAVAAVPHYTTKSCYASKGAGVRHLSTDRPLDVAVAKGFKERPYGSAGDDFVTCVQELVDAWDAREKQLAGLKTAYRIAALEEQYHALLDNIDPHLEAAEECPVFTIAELVRKIEFFQDKGENLPALILLADLRRIEGGAV